MSKDKKPPDPSPPPKDSEETARFKDLLRRLVAVPKEEVGALETQRRKRRSRVKSPGKKKGQSHDG